MTARSWSRGPFPRVCPDVEVTVISPSALRTMRWNGAASPGRSGKGSTAAGRCESSTTAITSSLSRTEDRLTFELKGERLAGVWHLVHTGPKDGKDQWLALMSKDLRLQAEGRPPAKPMLATLTAEAFDDAQWGFEPKWDGIRAIAMCDEETRLITRNDKDVTVAYPELRRMHEQVVALEAMLDGEIVAFEAGVPSFQRLQQRMHLRDERKIEEMARQLPVVYIVFDFSTSTVRT